VAKNKNAIHRLTCHIFNNIIALIPKSLIINNSIDIENKPTVTGTENTKNKSGSTTIDQINIFCKIVKLSTRSN